MALMKFTQFQEAIMESNEHGHDFAEKLNDHIEKHPKLDSGTRVHYLGHHEGQGHRYHVETHEDDYHVHVHGNKVRTSLARGEDSGDHFKTQESHVKKATPHHVAKAFHKHWYDGAQ